jgi:hypothetical protein
MDPIALVMMWGLALLLALMVGAQDKCSGHTTVADCANAGETCGWCAPIKLCTAWDLCLYQPTTHYFHKERECSEAGGEWVVYRNGDVCW